MKDFKEFFSDPGFLFPLIIMLLGLSTLLVLMAVSILM